MRQIFYCKMQQFYYIMRQLLHNATILLQIATIHPLSPVFISLTGFSLNAFIIF